MHAEPIPSHAGGGGAASQVQEDTSLADDPRGGCDHVAQTVEDPLALEMFMAPTAAAGGGGVGMQQEVPSSSKSEELAVTRSENKRTRRPRIS